MKRGNDATIVTPDPQGYGVPFVSKLKMMLVFTIHAGIYDSCWYLRSMVVVTLHAGIVNTSMKCKYQHES